MLEKLAEVAPEVLHGADSLQTMHSFMAALALMLDDATFARVLHALADHHPNTCAHPSACAVHAMSIHLHMCMCMSTLGMHTACTQYAHCMHRCARILSGDGGDVPDVGAKRLPGKEGRLKKINESPAKKKIRRSPKKATSLDWGNTAPALAILGASAGSGFATREVSPGESSRDSPEPPSEASNPSPQIHPPTVPACPIPSRPTPSPTVQAAISRLTGAVAASSLQRRPFCDVVAKIEVETEIGTEIDDQQRSLSGSHAGTRVHAPAPDAGAGVDSDATSDAPDAEAGADANSTSLTQAEMLKASEAVFELQRQLMTHVEGSYVPYVPSEAIGGGDGRGAGGGGESSPLRAGIVAASSSGAACPPADCSPLAPPTDSPKDTTATPVATINRPPAMPPARKTSPVALAPFTDTASTVSACFAAAVAAPFAHPSTRPPPHAATAPPPTTKKTVDALTKAAEGARAEQEEVRRFLRQERQKASKPAAGATAAAVVSTAAIVATRTCTEAAAVSAPAAPLGTVGESGALAVADGSTPQRRARPPSPDGCSPLPAATSPPARSTPLLGLYRAVIGHRASPARPSPFRPSPFSSANRRPKLSQAQPTTAPTPEVVRVRAEEFDDSPRSRLALPSSSPARNTAGSSPARDTAVLSASATEGPLDLEQREMLVQMQQAQALLEQDQQRLEQRLEQRQRGRDTPSPETETCLGVSLNSSPIWSSGGSSGRVVAESVPRAI